MGLKRDNLPVIGLSLYKPLIALYRNGPLLVSFDQALAAVCLHRIVSSWSG